MIESCTAEVKLEEEEGNAKCGGMKVTRRACHRGSRSDAIGKIGSIETAGAEDVMCCACGDQAHMSVAECKCRNDRKEERHPPCFRESPE